MRAEVSVTVCMDTASLTDKQRHAVLCEVREWYMLRSFCTINDHLFTVSISQRPDNRIYFRFDAAELVSVLPDGTVEGLDITDAEVLRKSVLNVIGTTFIGEWVHIGDDKVRVVEEKIPTAESVKETLKAADAA